jgi:predicted ATPase
MLSHQGRADKTNFADSGFGASQVLPLIVQGLTAEPQSLIIAEQPEIHLNPRLQCVLASLFGAIIQRGCRLLVETHSEHLLLAIRLLIASRKLDASKVALYFVEKAGDGSSMVRQVPIDTIGGISSESWPKGFFEDSLQQSLALAEAQARRPGTGASHAG